jgi:hypothetical protein
MTPSPRLLFRDRRVQIGGMAALSLAALIGAGVIVLTVTSRAEANAPEMADRARLSVIDQPAPEPHILSAADKLATLDPVQTGVPQAEPLDPALTAMLDQERRSDLQAEAEQRAIDARIQAEQQDDDPPADPKPAQTEGWTPNTEDPSA